MGLGHVLLSRSSLKKIPKLVVTAHDLRLMRSAESAATETRRFDQTFWSLDGGLPFTSASGPVYRNPILPGHGLQPMSGEEVERHGDAVASLRSLCCNFDCTGIARLAAFVKLNPGGDNYAGNIIQPRV